MLGSTLGATFCRLSSEKVCHWSSSRLLGGGGGGVSDSLSELLSVLLVMVREEVEEWLR